MGSMHTGLEETRGGIPTLAKYFAKRAEGGVGLIVTGGVSPNIRGWLKPLGMRLTASRHLKAQSIKQMGKSVFRFFMQDAMDTILFV